MESVKCLLVGDGCVGKTSLLLKNMTNDFFNENVPTVMDLYTYPIYFKERTFRVDIWDTAGQEDFENLRQFAYSLTDVFYICFAINDPVSYLNVENIWYKEVKHNCPQAIVILVGTKVDLRDDADQVIEKVENPQITIEDGQLLADRIQAYKYVECSALQNLRVKDVFDTGLLAYTERTEKVLIQPPAKCFCSVL